MLSRQKPCPPLAPSALARQPIRAGLLTIATLLFSACGGGGSDAPVNRPPVVAVQLTGEAVAGATTTFDTTGTTDPEGGALQRSWSYGDGTTGSADSHVYPSPGTYTATLNVTDTQAASATKSLTVQVAKCSTAGTQAAQLSPYPTVCVQTTRGEMVFEFYSSYAPVTVANFLKYVDDGFYASTLIHRVIPGFVIQGGGYATGLVPKPATYAAIPLESANGLKNWQYTLAMARTSAPDSATSQFFINLVANPGLDHDPTKTGKNGYAVFGQVISGTSVVDGVGTVPTGSVSGLTDVPLTDVLVRSMVRMP